MDTFYVGNQLVNNQSVAERKTWSLTTNQSVFPVRYDTGDVDVYKNGIKLRPGLDYTLNLAQRTSVTLNSPGVNGDFIEIIGWNGYSVAQPPKFIKFRYNLTAGGTVSTYSCNYQAGNTDVFVNGVKMILNDDFTGIDGTSITLVTPLTTGDTLEVAVYESFSMVDINAKLTNNQTFYRTDIVATAGQTVFTAAYTPGFLQVYLNGTLLQPSDYTAINGTSVTLLVAANLNDEVSIVAYSVFSVANVVQKSGDTMTGPLTLSGAPTSNLHASTKAYVDGKFPISSSGLVTGTIETAVQTPFSFRNKLINGGCRIQQRPNWTLPAGNSTASQYVLDRWLVKLTTVTGITGTIGKGSTSASSTFNCISGTGMQGIGGLNTITFSQRIEARNVSGLTGKTLTYRFKFTNNLGATATIQPFIKKPTTASEDNWSGGETAVYTPSTTTVANGATGTITGTTQALIESDFIYGLVFGFTINNGSLGTGGSFNAFDFQLEEGSVATPFEQIPISLDLVNCQRYFERVAENGYWLSFPWNGSATNQWLTYPYKATKRIASPTISVTGWNNVTPAVTYIGPNAVTWNSTSAFYLANNSVLTIDAEL